MPNLLNWPGANRRKLEEALSKRVDELEANREICETVDWIITSAGGTPYTQTRRIALLSAIVVQQSEVFDA